MTEKITLIYLNSSLTHASWVTIDESQKIIDSVGLTELDKLPPLISHEVYVIVPEQDVLLTSVVMPKLSRPRLLQALPFALEEQLVDDVETLHFAVGDYKANKPFPIAIVAHSKMQAWLALFKERGIAPRALIPAVFALPFTPPNWQANIFQEQCLVRTDEFSGFACERDNLAVLLELKLAEEPEGSATQVTHSHFSDQQLLEQIAGKITTLSAINLLQDSYKSKRQGTQIKKIWLISGVLALTLISLLFIADIVSYTLLKQHSDQLETAINTIYKHNFPQSKSIVAPRARMTEKMHRLAGGGSKNSLLILLAEIGKSLGEAPGVRIQNLDFREKQLTLEVTSAAFDNLDVFTHLLTQQGLAVKQQNAAVAGSQVKATLIIRAGA